MRPALLALLCVGMLGLATPAAAETADPFLGTGGARPWLSGNTTPAATVPFGMVQLGPDTTGDAASGYDAASTDVRGFSPTHVSGAGCRTFGAAQ